jgi:hypothetical protein
MEQDDRDYRSEVTLELETDDPDTEGHAGRIQFSSPDDEERIKVLLAKQERVRVRLDPVEDDSDTEGHAATAAAVTLRILDDEDDTDGHAISIHFPTARDARAFRNRLILTGALVGSVTLAGVGIGLSQTPTVDTGVAAPAGAQAQGATDGWQHSGIAGAASGAAGEVTDGWQHSGATGTGGTADQEQTEPPPSQGGITPR